MTPWDMHTDPGTRVPVGLRLAEGALVRGVVVCHHPFGVGVLVDDVGQYGHVNLPHVRDSGARGAEDFPRIGMAVSAVVLGYDGHGQLRLTTRLSDLPGVGAPLGARADGDRVRASGGEEPTGGPQHRGGTPGERGSAVRYLLTLCLMLGLYFLAEWVVPSFRTRPFLLVAAVLIAPIAGALLARRQPMDRRHSAGSGGSG